MKECNCKCPTLSYSACPNSFCQENLCEMDCIIAKLKSELFEKMQKTFVHWRPKLSNFKTK